MRFFLVYRHYIGAVLSAIALGILIFLYSVKGWHIPSVEFLAVLIFLAASVKGIQMEFKEKKEELMKAEEPVEKENIETEE